MRYKNKMSACEFIDKRASETVRAKDVDGKALYDRAALIENLKMMAHYEKTLCVLQNSRGEYIEICHWRILKDRYSIFASDQYTFIPVIDYFVMLYKDKINYSLPRVAKTAKQTLSYLEQPQKTIKLKKSGNSDDNISINRKEKKIDSSLGIFGVIEQFNKMDEYDFLDLVSLEPLSGYINLLSSRYHVYILIEIVEDYERMQGFLNHFHTIKDKKKKKEKYLYALDRLMEVKYLYSAEQLRVLNEIKKVINDNIAISSEEYRRHIKQTITKKLEEAGFSPTSAKKFYTDLQNYLN